MTLVALFILSKAWKPITWSQSDTTFYTLKVKLNPSLHCDNRCLVFHMNIMFHTWLKSYCVTKFQRILCWDFYRFYRHVTLVTIYALTMMKFHAAPVPTRTYLWSISDTVTPYLGQYLQLSEDMFRKWLKNRNHYKNKSLNILLLQTSECKQLLLPKIYSSCILPEPTSSNDSSHSLPNPGQPKCVIIISTIEGVAFRPWKQRGNWRPSGQFHFQTPRGSFRGFTAYPRPQTTIIIIIIIK